MTIARKTRVWFFVALALSINVIDPQLVRIFSRPAVNMAAVFDLAVAVPAIYYWLVVRGGIQPLATLLPVCVFALFRATWIIPGSWFVRPLLGAGVEIAFVALVAARTRQSLRSTRGADILERIEAVVLRFARLPRLASIAAVEMGVIYYALASWGRKPEIPAGVAGFSTHERSGAASLFGALAAISVVEIPLLHLMVVRWNHTAAWILTAVGVYSGIWLLGMSRALVLRPVLVGSGELVIRSGILWTVRVPLHLIESIHRGSGVSDIRLCPGGDPNLSIGFSEPVTAVGMFGIRRRVARVALFLDDPAGFEHALSADQ